MKIFVYGTLKRKKGLHNFYLKDSKFIKKDSVNGKLYRYCGLPFLLLYHNKKEKVPGEVYDVSAEVFNSIKEMEESARYKTVKIKTVSGENVYAFSYNKKIAKMGERIRNW